VKINFFQLTSFTSQLNTNLYSGFANSSLYTGDIEYINMPVQGSYWILPVTCMSRPPFFFFASIKLFLAINVQGNSINLPSGKSSYAAIDTGTTLVGGPSKYISEIFAQIPGSSPGTGDFENYYTYRAFNYFLPFIRSKCSCLPGY
jgi:cathepsin D